MDALISNYYVSVFLLCLTLFSFSFFSSPPLHSVMFYLMHRLFISPALASGADRQFLFHPSPPQVKLWFKKNTLFSLKSQVIIDNDNASIAAGH